MIFNLEVFQRPALQPTKGREATDSGDMGVSINGSTHLWMVYIYRKNMEKPTKMDDLGVPYFRKPPYEYYSTFLHQFQPAKQHNWLSLFQQKT